MTASEMTPADFAAISGNNNDNGFGGGNGAWWLIVLFIFALCGYGGFGGFGGGGSHISISNTKGSSNLHEFCFLRCATTFFPI